MARAMWRGAIQFGLVTIPVKLYLATESRGGLSFHLLHKECLNRVQMKTHCPEHGEISRSDTVRGFEWSKGQYVVIDEKDFDAVPLRTVRAIEIEQFVEAHPGEYATTFVKQCYYLEPEAVGRKAFYLLRSVLAETGLEAICKIVLKDREALASINPYSKTMLLSTLYWPDEVREVGELDLPAEEYEFKPAEKQMARQLVETMTGEFDPSQYRDEYREALMKVIEAKIEGEPIEAPRPVEAPSKLTDLMAVLEASVAAARESRGGTGAGAAKSGEKEPTSVAAARKRKAAGSAAADKAKPAARSSSRAPAKEAEKAEPAAPRRRKSA
ncbi:MAG: end-binding protein Ku [Chloroflexota bacterium]|nr:end-binding protein Ku [Chloroflexota bacterium]